MTNLYLVIPKRLQPLSDLRFFYAADRRVAEGPPSTRSQLLPHPPPLFPRTILKTLDDCRKILSPRGLPSKS